MEMTSPEKDMATCCSKRFHTVKSYMSCLSGFIRVTISGRNGKLYLIDTQAWMIHWKRTNIHVHKTKYAIRKKGNRWK